MLCNSGASYEEATLGFQTPAMELILDVLIHGLGVGAKYLSEYKNEFQEMICALN